MERKRSMSNCPVCLKPVPSSQIEGHVDKCLFLNSQAGNLQSSQLKRPLDHDNVSSKKIKHEESLLDTSFCVPSTSEAFETKKEVSPHRRKHSAPLAELMRPSSLEDYIGQKHFMGRDSVIKSLIEQHHIPNMILWGPPGCGKTTLANIIQKSCSAIKGEVRFIKLSATTCGVNDIKEVVQSAKNEVALFQRRTILFLDEIHHFNKTQQDIFLPHVETGTITLIGATTENPSFSLNSALLSRCRVFVLEALKTDQVKEILNKAVAKLGGVVVEADSFSSSDPGSSFQIEDEALDWLAESCEGDARIALSGLEMVFDSAGKQEAVLTREFVVENIKRSHMLYDRKGEEHYNTISALHKSIRASDDNAALYWLARMLDAGEDPLFIARRLVIASTEDIGLADPLALSLCVTSLLGCKALGRHDCEPVLAQLVVYLARAPKSTETYDAIHKAKSLVANQKGRQPPVPLHLRNAPTKLMKDIGYGKGYNTKQKGESGLSYLPEGLEQVDFFTHNSRDPMDLTDLIKTSPIK